MRYDVPRRFAERDTGLVQRLNTCIAIDRTRWDQDVSYKEEQANYLRRLREFGWYIDEREVRCARGSAMGLACCPGLLGAGSGEAAD